jgi:hypothetical protein
VPRKRKPPIPEAHRAARRQNIVAFNTSRGNRPALKSGISSAEVLKNGKAPAQIPDAAEINAEVDAVVSQIVADLGGESEVTANRKTIIAAQRTVLTVLSLARRYIVREGLVNRKGKPHPLLGLVVSYANSARLNAVALGLERRARKVGPDSLSEYIDLRAATPAKDEGQQ